MNYRWYLVFNTFVYTVYYRPYRGHFVAAKHMLEGPQHAAKDPEWAREEPTVKRRVPKEAGPRPRSLASLEPKECVILGPVAEHLAVITYDDGGVRANGVVILLCQGSEYTAIAKDPDSEMQLRARGATLYDTLENLAVLLSQEDAPWETDTRPVQRRASGKPK